MQHEFSTPQLIFYKIENLEMNSHIVMAYVQNTLVQTTNATVLLLMYVIFIENHPTTK